MQTIFTILIIIFVMILVAAPLVYFQTRKSFREQKNYERGLKIVPLLIHLPPPSDDTEIGNRDVRDVTDYFKGKVPLAIKRAFKALLDRTGNNIID